MPTTPNDEIHMTNNTIRLALSCAVLGAMLAGCGGGSSGSASDGSAAATSPTGTTTDDRSHHATDNVALAASAYAASSNGGLVTMTVNRTNGSTGAASVQFATADGTAIAGTNYQATSGTLNWASGDSSPKTFSVKVARNSAASKEFKVALSAPSGATLGSVASATCTIASASTTGNASSGGSSSGTTSSSSSSSGGSSSSGSSSGTTSSSSSSSSGAGASGQTFWVYYNGTFAWPGDYSFEAVPNYQDTSGGPLSGQFDVKVSVTGQWGGFQPYATNWSFDDSAYAYLTFALKPTVSNMQAQLYFMKVGDIPTGNTIDIFSGKYGPAPVAGQWNTYKIPLSDIGVQNENIYKFAIQDQTGMSTDVFYLDNIGFTN